MNTKLQPITDFDALTDDQRDQLHNWLEEGIATRTVMTKLKDEFGFDVTYNKLYRYGKRLLQSRLLVDTADHNDTAQNIRTFLDILNGNPVPYDEAGLALIQKRAFEAACAPKLRISQLATLQRVFHYKTARAECACRAAQTDRRNDLAERSLQLRHEIHTFRKHRHHVRLESRLNLNRNPNLFSEYPENTDANTSSRDARTSNDTSSADPRASASLSQQGTTIREANVSNAETNSCRAREATGLGERFSHTTTECAPAHPYPSSETPSTLNSQRSTFLSPEVIANTNLYDQKIDVGEIRVIYAPGKHYEIEYCNPADQPALERMHKSAPVRFFEDPTRTNFLPPLRTFGKNPYIPPQNTQNSGLITQNLEAEDTQ